MLLVAISATSLWGQIPDITIPLDKGSVTVRKARFGGGDKWYSKDKQLVISFEMENHTASSWNNVDLEFKIAGFCNYEPHQWSYVFHGSYLPAGASPTSRQFQEVVGPLPGKNMDCNAEIIKAKLVFAAACANPLCLGNAAGRRIEGPSSEPLDLEREFEPIRAKRAIEAEEQKRKDVIEAERLRKVAAAEAEEEELRAAAEAERQERRAAAEAERQKKLAAERQRAQAEYAKRKAEEDARDAAERAKIWAACSLIYTNTANKKMGDLTVKEDQQVRACQGLGLYPPR